MESKLNRRALLQGLAGAGFVGGAAGATRGGIPEGGMRHAFPETAWRDPEADGFCLVARVDGDDDHEWVLRRRALPMSSHFPLIWLHHHGLKFLPPLRYGEVVSDDVKCKVSVVAGAEEQFFVTAIRCAEYGGVPGGAMMFLYGNSARDMLATMNSLGISVAFDFPKRRAQFCVNADSVLTAATHDGERHMRREHNELSARCPDLVKPIPEDDVFIGPPTTAGEWHRRRRPSR